MSLTLPVYCIACSVQQGANKKSVTHELEIKASDIKKTRSTYTAYLVCPVKGKKISTFIKKSNAEQLINPVNLTPLSPVQNESSSQ